MSHKPHLAISVTKFDGSTAQTFKLNEIAADWLGGHSFWTVESILESLSSPGMCLWAATDTLTAHWLGVTLIKVAVDDAELVYIHTMTQYRGRGIGMQMLEAVLNALKSDNLMGLRPQKMFLEVRASNAPAQELYKQAGFWESGRRKKYYKDGEDALIFEIDLS